jgi:hypothetical protein
MVTLGMSSAARAEAGSLELMREGVSLRRKGNDQGALERFRQAYEIDHSSRALAQMGLAEQALGRWVPAYEHLTQALKAISDPWIQTNGATLRASGVEVGQHVGMLEILGGSPAAEVRIDGVPRGTLPLAGPLVLPLGSVVIALGGEGFVSVQRAAVIRAQQLTRESFDPLVLTLQTPPVPRSATVAIAHAADQNPRAIEIERPEPSRGDNSSPEGQSPGWIKAKWIAWATAAAALGVGALAYTQQSDAASQFNGSCFYDPMGTLQTNATASLDVRQCASLASRQDSWYAVEIGGFVGAGTLAALGLVLFLLEPSSAHSASAGLSCAPGINDGVKPSVGCTWRF